MTADYLGDKAFESCSPCSENAPILRSSGLNDRSCCSSCRVCLLTRVVFN